MDGIDYWSNHIRTTGVICPGIRKIAIFDFVYTLASTIINQLAPNLVKIYMTVRFRMSWIMGVIAPEQLELFALELKNFFVSLCLHCSIYKYQPFSSNLVKIYMTLKILDEFDYRCNQTRTGVICP